MLRKLIKSALNSCGYSIVKNAPARIYPPDMEPEFIRLADQCQPFTMTGPLRMYGLYRAIRYIQEAGIPGDVVECGVWRGGSAMLAALALLETGDKERRLWLYDTYAGMSEPTEKDVSHDNRPARQEWESAQKGEINSWCYAGLDEVRKNLLSTGFSESRVEFIKGRVEETIPCRAPGRISLLRLDTDWYESTRHEMEHLFPRLSAGGVLILDDYGHWQGAKMAVDEYFSRTGIQIFLSRLDYSGRIGVKPL